MMKRYINIILWFLTTAAWTIITLLFCKWFSVSKGINMQNALFYISLGVIIVGVLIVMGRSSARNPVEFTQRSHPLFSASDTDKILTNNHGARYGYDYNWKFFFNGYSILFSGIICIIIDVLLSM